MATWSWAKLSEGHCPLDDCRGRLVDARRVPDAGPGEMWNASCGACGAAVQWVGVPARLGRAHRPGEGGIISLRTSVAWAEPPLPGG